jgi:hypothetical protein
MMSGAHPMNRGKNVIASQDVDLRRYWSRAPFRVALEGQLLSAHLAESEIIIRLGAIANGILAVGRSLRPVDDLRSLRDRMQATTLFASHVKEAAKILNHRHGGLGWTLAAEGVRGGHHLASSHLQTLQLLLDDEAAFLQTCNRIRDDFGFHIGPEPVKLGARTLSTSCSSLHAPSRCLSAQ